jgi:hypothetical protein
MRCCSACRPGLGSAFPAPEGGGFGSSGGSAYGCPRTRAPSASPNPGAHIGFGYTMNQMQAGLPVDPRALRIIDALYASL